MERRMRNIEVSVIIARGLAQWISYPTFSIGSGTSHSGFPRFNPVELERGAVGLNRG